MRYETKRRAPILPPIESVIIEFSVQEARHLYDILVSYTYGAQRNSSPLIDQLLNNLKEVRCQP